MILLGLGCFFAGVVSGMIVISLFITAGRSDENK